MKIEISTEEIQKILKFKIDYKLNLENVEVDPLCDSIEVKDFIRDFLKNRGIKRPRVYEQGIYAFGNVGMHTDDLSPKSAMTLCLMISGSGKLYSWNGKKVLEFDMRQGEGVIFDFNLPHSFETTEKCQAFLVDIPKKYKKHFILQ